MDDPRLTTDYKHSSNHDSLDNVNENISDSIIKSLSLIDNETVISNKSLRKRFGLLSDNDYGNLIEYLLNRRYIQFSTESDVSLYSLTHEGKSFFREKIRDSQTRERFLRSIENTEDLNLYNKLILEESINNCSSEEYFPSFIGCFIADKSGKTLLTFELYEGALESYLNFSNEIDGEQKDLELIPMFISAFEKFSQELNFKSLSGLKLEGTNLKMQSFNFENKYTITHIINPKVNLKPIEDKIEHYFRTLFENYKNELELSLRTGLVENISHLNELGREMLKELNKFVYLVEFKNIVYKLDNFDMVYAQALYSKLDKLYKEFNFKYTLTLEKIKQLKINLLKAMLNEDLEELKVTINKAQDIESNLS